MAKRKAAAKAKAKAKEKGAAKAARKQAMAAAPPIKRRPGRPTEYDPEVHPGQGYKLALLGASIEEMADVWGHSRETVYQWQREHPDFLDAITRGRDAADANVASRLYDRAMGYSHPAVKIFMPQGAAEPVYAPYTEHYPPDTQAASLWLRNRQPKKWRDKQQLEHSGPDNTPLGLTVLIQGQEHGEGSDADASSEAG